MRQLKFRVWNKNKVDWDEPCLIEVFNNDGILGHLYDPNREYTVIQQYIGSNDKNGNEIYEGDILKLHNGQLHTVEFIEENNETEMSGYFFSNFGSEIIGNIFQNPELLEQ